MAGGEDKQLVIEELNELLDSLSPQEAKTIFKRLTIAQVLKLHLAVQTAISDNIKQVLMERNNRSPQYPQQ